MKTKDTKKKRGTKRINICLPEQTHKQGKTMAQQDAQRFSNWLQVLILTEANRRGIRSKAA